MARVDESKRKALVLAGLTWGKQPGRECARVRSTPMQSRIDTPMYMWPQPCWLCWKPWPRPAAWRDMWAPCKGVRCVSSICCDDMQCHAYRLASACS